MSWKSGLFSIYDAESGYFSHSPKPDLQKSIILAQSLPFKLTDESYIDNLDVWPSSDSLFGVGVYQHGAIVVERSLVNNYCETANKHPLTKRMIDMFPNGTFISLGLHSGVNYFGYSVIEKGKLIRCYGGSEDHIDTEIGELLPEEKPHFEKSYVKGNMRYFKYEDSPDEEHDAPAYGETLVLDLSSRLFGKPMEEFDTLPVKIFYFKKKPWYKFW